MFKTVWKEIYLIICVFLVKLCDGVWDKQLFPCLCTDHHLVICCFAYLCLKSRILLMILMINSTIIVNRAVVAWEAWQALQQYVFCCLLANECVIVNFSVS